MSQQSSSHYWDKTAEAFDTIYSGKAKPALVVLLDKWLRRDIYQRVDETVRIINQMGANQSVLDVGCGTGRLCVPLAKAGHTVIGVDFSPKMLSLAKQLAGEAQVLNQCGFYLGDLLQNPPQELSQHQAFDVAVALGVFDYISEPIMLLEKMRAFSPRKIICTFPKSGTIRCYIRQLRYRLQSLKCPLFFFTSAQVKAMGDRLGAGSTHIQSMGELHFTVFDFEQS